MTINIQAHEAARQDRPPLDRPIEQVPPIELSQGQAIRQRADLERFVESAALAACEFLYDQNIKTVSASANSKDCERAYIVVDYESLSDENKPVAGRIGELISKEQDEQPYGVKISVLLTPGEKEADISLKLSAACGPLAKQELTWALTYDLAQLKDIYGYKDADGAHPEDFVALGFYYDEATETFHESEELYTKSLWKPTLEAAKQQPQNLEEAVDPSSPETMAANMVEYLRQHPEHVGNGWYSEVHIVDGQPVFLPAPRTMQEGGASIGGSHSIIDELRNGDGYRFPIYMEAAEQLTGESDSALGMLAAKGLIKNVDGVMSLELRDIRRIDNKSWIDGLYKQASALGLDGGIVIRQQSYLTDERHEPIRLDEVKKKYEMRSQFTRLRDIGEVRENQFMLSGVVTEIDTVSSGMAINNWHKSIRVDNKEEYKLSLVDARTDSHAPVYDTLGIKDYHHYIDVMVEGQPIRVGARYSSDTQRPGDFAQSINLFYDRDYGDSVAGFETALVGHLLRVALPHCPTARQTIAISKGKLPAEVYTIRQAS